MPKKKKPSFLTKFWKIFISAIDYFVVALVPSVIAIIGLLGDKNNIILAIPVWVWVVTTVILLILAFSKGLQRYKDDTKRAAEPKSHTKRDRTKVKSNRQSGGITAETVNIYGSDKGSASNDNIDSPIVVPDKDGFDKLEAAFPLWNRDVPSQNRVKRYGNPPLK